MNKEIINVPNGITYISEWKEFLYHIPPGQVIINKKFPGCGLTTWTLTNNLPTVLCVPRRFLGENKAEQMDEMGCNYFYFQPSKKTSAKRQKEENEKSFQSLKNYIQWQTPFTEDYFHIPKVIVTYDSLPTIYPILSASGVPFVYVVDEHQSSFQDYVFKPEVIERVSALLKTLETVWYISATPILEKYLDKMEYLQSLPYIELNWPQDKIIDVEVYYRPMSSTASQLSSIISEYKRTGVFDTMTLGDTVYDSTEAVFFVNNVTDIAKAIHDNGLRPDEVNILVAQDKENIDKLNRYAGPGITIGKIPTKGKKHATFTFCSKCVYYGVDFYSPSASTFIFADANVRSMNTDLSLDFLQIIGRQRLDSNIFRHRCHIYVKTNCQEVESEGDFIKSQESKWQKSKLICDKWNELPQDAIEAIKSVDRDVCPYGVLYADPLTGERKAKNCINARIAEHHAWEMRNKIYRDHETVQSLIHDSGYRLANYNAFPNEVKEFVNQFLLLNDFPTKMHYYACFFDTYPQYLNFAPTISRIPGEYYNYYLVFGSIGLNKLGYDETTIRKRYEREMLRQQLSVYVYSAFEIGRVYTRESVKQALKTIYIGAKINRTAKATDLLMFFDCSETKINVNGKRVPAYKLNKKI